MRHSIPAILLLLLWLPATAWAETATLQIYHLPLDEAAQAARSQLSPAGSVTTLPSRRLLIISDTPARIRQVRTLLQKLDQPQQQYRVRVEISEVENSKLLQAGITSLRLPGGWIRAGLRARSGQDHYRKTFSLLTSGNRKGEIEAGTLQPLLQRTRQWLAGYGVIESQSMELVPVTSGFHVEVAPASGNQVRIRIAPWARRDNRSGIIELAGASTEVTVLLNRQVTLAASSGEAENYGRLLLSGRSDSRSSSLLIKLTCEKY